ncbi:hypothetical protein ACS0TY_024041 [Phlomoides rotata]
MVVLYVCLFLSSLVFLFVRLRKSAEPRGKLPPGKTGWPVIGETLEFLSTGEKGYPEKFIFDRIAKYSSSVFRTHLFGEKMAVLGGAAGNKFLFSNENKLVQVWWPRSVGKLFPSDIHSSTVEAIILRKMLPDFLKLEALHRYVGEMDIAAQRHFEEGWEKKEQVTVFPLANKYTFSLACRLFLSMEDPVLVEKFAKPFDLMAAAFNAIPVNLPGTRYNTAFKTSRYIRKELLAIVKQRKVDLVEGKATPTQDVLSHILSLRDDDGKEHPEFYIADKIFGLLMAGHDTVASACAAIVKYLAELPHIYDAVYQEQMEIKKSKAPGELLNLGDVQKMKYSWNVALEVMRLSPPLPSGLREALTDFTYNGFHIPKGWKIYFSPNTTHRDAQFFPEPLKFDPSRFDGSGPAPYTYVAFGGGPRMCPGQQYARHELMVFVHHLVTRFKVEKVIPDEQIIVAPLPAPAKGLPVRLFPHKP